MTGAELTPGRYKLIIPRSESTYGDLEFEVTVKQMPGVEDFMMIWSDGSTALYSEYKETLRGYTFERDD